MTGGGGLPLPIPCATVVVEHVFSTSFPVFVRQIRGHIVVPPPSLGRGMPWDCMRFVLETENNKTKRVPECGCVSCVYLCVRVCTCEHLCAPVHLYLSLIHI